MEVYAKREITEVEIPAMVLLAREAEALGEMLQEFLGEERLSDEPIAKSWETRYPNLKALYDAMIKEDIF